MEDEELLDVILQELNNVDRWYRTHSKHRKMSEHMQTVSVCKGIPISYITKNFLFVYDGKPVNPNKVSFARLTDKHKWVKRDTNYKPRKVNTYEKAIAEHINAITKELEIMDVKNMVPQEMLKNITSNLVSLIPNKSGNKIDNQVMTLEDVPRIISYKIIEIITKKTQEDNTVKSYSLVFKHMGKKYTLTFKYDTVTYYILMKLTGPEFKYVEYSTSRAIEISAMEYEYRLRKLFIQVVKDFLEMEFKHDYN